MDLRPTDAPSSSGRPPADLKRAPADPWSFRIATIAGIPIYLHFTFLLLMIWLALGSLHGAEGGRSATDLLVVVGLFACVVLHELGHALVAQRYRVPVSSITLYPIGGLARIERQPAPHQEIWIAVAGPAVNLAIALVLSLVQAVVGKATAPSPMAVQSRSWLVEIIGLNMILALFNMIPAFPMDGGRLLRAVLALRLPYPQATAVAARIGQAFALVGGVLGFVSGNWGLMLIALFIYWGAGQESTAVDQEALFRNVLVREAMITDVQTLRHGATFRDAADLLLATSQHDFPVVLGDEVVGLLTRESLLRGLASEGPDAYVASAMQRRFVRAEPEGHLGDLLQEVRAIQGPALVFQGDRLVGMVTMENLIEFMMIRQITTERTGGPTGSTLTS